MIPLKVKCRSIFTAVIVLGVWVLFPACKKTEESIPKVPKGKILVGLQVGANNIYNYYGNEEKYNTVDTLVADSNFYLIPYPQNGGYHFNGINLTFKSLFDTSYLCQYRWQIGTDPTERTYPLFNLFFNRPYPSITVRLITKFSPRRGTGLAGIDTSYQTIHIGDVPPLFGEYEGFNTDEPNHKFKIKIGWDFEPYPAVNRSSFYLTNLPENYPIKSEIMLPRGTGFGIDDATIRGGQALYYRNDWVNCVYALGFMNKNHDSIKIRYNYGIIANYPANSSDWSRVVSRNFIGKKL